MRISAKAKYGLSALIYIAQDKSNKAVTTTEISARLDISKLYLEQIFTALKTAAIVRSVKGPQGGYLLNKDAAEITAYEILSALDKSLFDKPDLRVGENAIETAIGKLFFETDAMLKEKFGAASLRQLADSAAQTPHMFYI